MRTNKNVPTGTIALVSMEHIRPSTLEAMKGRLRRELEPVAFYGEGVFILGGDISAERRSRWPADLVEVLDWANDHGLDWVRLDTGIELVEGLPHYRALWCSNEGGAAA